MGLPSIDYTPRDSDGTVLHRIVGAHLETFLATAACLRDGEGVPRSSRKSFGRSCAAAGWPAGSRDFGVARAEPSDWSRSRARGAVSARAVGAAG